MDQMWSENPLQSMALQFRMSTHLQPPEPCAQACGVPAGGAEHDLLTCSLCEMTGLFRLTVITAPC